MNNKININHKPSNTRCQHTNHQVGHDELLVIAGVQSRVHNIPSKSELSNFKMEWKCVSELQAWLFSLSGKQEQPRRAVHRKPSEVSSVDLSLFLCIHFSLRSWWCPAGRARPAPTCRKPRRSPGSGGSGAGCSDRSSSWRSWR